MYRLISLFILSLIALSGSTQDSMWLTDVEKSDFTKTPRYDETLSFCSRLVAASSMVSMHTMGESSQGRKIPFLLVDKQGLTDPASIRASGRIILWVQACIHPGESEGKDAGMMLLRDLVVRKIHTDLLEHVSLLFIPIFNVDGHERFGRWNRINQNGPEEMGWRITATNLNLNRDFLKADTPEMQSWLRLFNEWLPEFFIDTHTTDGADYQYILTYYMNIYGGMDEDLTSWTKDIFLNRWVRNMENDSIPVFPYIEFRSWHDPKSGIEMDVSPPMLSQGYTALRNRPGLLIETHMLKRYEQRVKSTYQSLVNAMTVLNRESTTLRVLEQKADAGSSASPFRKQPFPLKYKTLFNDSILVNFRGVHYTKQLSTITGDHWYKYGKEKETLKIPVFEKTAVEVSVKLPEAYIIPVEWKDVINRLKVHGIRIFLLPRDTLLKVLTYRISNPKWQSTPYEGRHPLTSFDLEEVTVEKKFCKGSALVDMNQPASRIIAHILEPRGNGSYLYWGFFDAVLEQKEYAENYVMEEMALQMLSEDPRLKEEFEAKKKAEKQFAENPNAILNWFYSKTPYWDPVKDIYPVGRLTSRETVDSLLKK
jgi:hypothetical protein